MNCHDLVHKKILNSMNKIEGWFQEKRAPLNFPIYSSFDIRDSGCKIAPVDANVFPAGFNNICGADQDSSVDLMKSFIETRYPGRRRIMLFTEEHTENPYYADNAYTIRSIIERAGFEVFVAWPRQLPGGQLHLETASGKTIEVFEAKRVDGGVVVGGVPVDLIVSNNDFSQTYTEFMDGLDVPMTPAYKLGWHNRRKDVFFRLYNELVNEFTDIIGIDCGMLNIATETHSDFDINDEASRARLARHVDEFLGQLKNQYGSGGVEYEPYVYIKNSAGTYGLGVTAVRNGDDVVAWNNKARKKMKAAKGGGGFVEVILQEGIPTSVTDEQDGSAEPVIYTLGSQLAGGFLRTHGKKDVRESLNSPGAVYKRLCVSDLKISVEGLPMENVYGWIGKLGALAVAQEAQLLS
ncbi:MAG: glutamate--cysteine ligase [Bdellovibrionales bacterium]